MTTYLTAGDSQSTKLKAHPPDRFGSLEPNCKGMLKLH
jgi:hypothetical protein